MAGTREGNRESVIKARVARAAKIAARREQEAADRKAAVARQLAAVRAKDVDQVTTVAVHYVNGKPYGPGVIRAHPDVILTIRDQIGYRRRHHLDPVTALPEPSARPDAIRPIRPTGVGPGEPVSPWAQQWLSGQAAETYADMLDRERRPEPSNWGSQSPRCFHAGSGPCLQCGGFERSPSRAQTRRSIFGETLA